MRDTLISDYTLKIKSMRADRSRDPYRHILYKIIGRLELSRKTVPEVIQVAEDYMWLQLELLRNYTEVQTSSEKYTVADLQSIINSFGPSHFNPKGTNPILFFNLLLMTGQFESAIAYLYWTEQYRIDSIHFGIALAYYGLLKVVDVANETCDALINSPDFVASDSKRLRAFPTDAAWKTTISRVNMSKILFQYSKALASINLLNSLDYLSFLSLQVMESGDSEQPESRPNIAHCCVQELLLSTNQPDRIIGEIQIDGTRAVS